MAQKLPKMSQNAHSLTVFDSMQQYATVCNNMQQYATFKKVFISYTKQIGWPVSAKIEYQIAKRILNIFE